MYYIFLAYFRHVYVHFVFADWLNHSHVFTIIFTICSHITISPQVCLHVDYDVLLFKYYDERQFLNQPELFNDPDKFEYSACSQMLQEDSWCKWAAEDQEQQKQELQEEGMGVAKVDVETTTVQQEQETSPVPEPVLKPEKEVTDKTETITKADADTTPGYQSESKQDSSQPVAVLERKLFVADVSPSHGESGLEGVVEEKH